MSPIRLLILAVLFYIAYRLLFGGMDVNAVGIAADFIGETYAAIKVADTALITLSAASTQGTEVGTENGVEIAKKF